MQRSRPRTSGGARRKRQRSRRPEKGRAWSAWLPLLVAFAVTPFAVKAASLLVLSGPGALRLLFPTFTLLEAHAPATFAAEQRDTLAGWAMWVQLPAYGVLLSLMAWRRKFLFGAALVILLHAGAIAATLLFP